MKKKAVLIVAALSLLVSAQVNAIESIKVLIAKSGAVLDSDALNMLAQVNAMMENSGLSNRQFVNAHPSGFVIQTSCIGFDREVLLECAKTTLETTRNQYNADIVLMLVPFLDSVSGFTTCGFVSEQMINLLVIEQANRALGRAVVSNQCMLTQGLRPASHEALHLLSIEHKLLDPKVDWPLGARDNHAASQVNVSTAGGIPADCNPNYTCTIFDNKMSEDGENLSNGFPAGNSLHSNAKNVVSNISWDIVAAYLPVPQVED